MSVTDLSVADLEFHDADALVSYSLDSEVGVVRRTDYGSGYIYEVCDWRDYHDLQHEAREQRPRAVGGEAYDTEQPPPWEDADKIPAYLWKESN